MPATMPPPDNGEDMPIGPDDLDESTYRFKRPVIPKKEELQENLITRFMVNTIPDDSRLEGLEQILIVATKTFPVDPFELEDGLWGFVQSRYPTLIYEFNKIMNNGLKRSGNKLVLLQDQEYKESLEKLSQEFNIAPETLSHLVYLNGRRNQIGILDDNEGKLYAGAQKVMDINDKALTQIEKIVALRFYSLMMVKFGLMEGDPGIEGEIKILPNDVDGKNYLAIATQSDNDQKDGTDTLSHRQKNYLGIADTLTKIKPLYYAVLNDLHDPTNKDARFNLVDYQELISDLKALNGGSENIAERLISEWILKPLYGAFQSEIRGSLNLMTYEKFQSHFFKKATPDSK